MHVKSTAYAMLMSDTLCLSNDTLLALDTSIHATHAVYTFSSPLQDVLMVEDFHPHAVQGIKHCMQTPQASHRHGNISVPTIVVKQEGGFYGS